MVAFTIEAFIVMWSSSLIEQISSIYQDRNLSCGQRKHEILYQLRELAKSEPGIQQDVKPRVNHHTVADEDEKDSSIQHKFQTYQHDEEHPTFNGNEV